MITVNFKCIKGNDITKERVLAGFSPCFVEWFDSSIVGNKVGKLTAAVVGGGTHTFDNLIPNADGKFYFDLSMVAQPYLLMCKAWRAKIYEPFVNDATVNDLNGFLTFADVVDVMFKFSINTTDSSEMYISFTRSALQLNQVNRASMMDYVRYEDAEDEEEAIYLSVLLHSQNIRRWNGYPIDISFMYAKPTQSIGASILGAKLVHNGVDVTTAGLPTKSNKYSAVVSFCLEQLIDDMSECEIHAIGTFTGGDKMYNIYPFTLYYSADECGHYIRWRNNLGGWSYWLFDANASYTEQVGNRDNILEVFTTDPYLESTKRMLERSKVEQITLATSTSLDWEVDHLSDLSTSTEVYLYKLPKGSIPQGKPEEWEQMKVVNLTYDPTTDRTPVKAYRLTIEKIDTITQSC